MYGFKILCTISEVPFEILHKTLEPYTAKYALYKVSIIWRIMILNDDILSSRETVGWVIKKSDERNCHLHFMGSLSLIGVIDISSLHRLYNHYLGM